MNCLNRFGPKVHHGLFSLTMRILITGGFGFVGGRLAVHLAQAGHQIVLGTRHLTASPEWLPQAEVRKIEWNDEIALHRSCDNVDVIIHGAGMNAQDSATDPIGALAFNGLASARLVAAANHVKVKKFIYLSTAHVYANPLIGNINEETCPRNLHPYATSHLAGEQAILSASQYGSIQSIVLRLSNAFGTPVHENVNCWMLVINDLCKQAVQSNKLTLQTSGVQERDFIGLVDLCFVIEKLIGHSRLQQTNLLNVGNGTSKPVLEISMLIQERCTEILGFTPDLIYRKSAVIEKPIKLNYSIDHLNALGISHNNGINIEEIDNLLLFCRKTFSKY